MSTLPFPLPGPYPRQLHLWEPEGSPRGLVLLSHGMAEHIARYDHVGQALVNLGFVVAGYNHLGHGPEAPLLGWMARADGWGAMLQDLRGVMDFMAARHPGLPRVLLGHSMGSFLAREYALRYPDGLDALVLSGTGWHPRALCLAGLLPARALSLLGRSNKPSGLLDRLAFSAHNKRFLRADGTGYEWLSRDDAQVRAYARDPLCGFVFTAGGFADLFSGLLALSDTRRLAALPNTLPVYLMSGMDDPVGGWGRGVETIARQYREAGLVDVTVRLYAGARHELFNETNRAQVISELAGWLDGLAAH
ncbi:MAG: alpha/beta hydrolase [Clostridiales bacterium]|nr:alpha/beta hydrolase [Clostridiales bacterium]